MSLNSKLENVGLNLFKNMESVQDIWSDFFGSNFQSVWNDPDMAIKKLIKKAKSVISQSVGIDENISHLTLFMRDPLTDRLVLEFSTQECLNIKHSPPPESTLFRSFSQNYNSDKEYCFYDLRDSLRSAEEKKTKDSSETRGLTGWVAVTGIPLRVNSSRSKESLEDMVKENALAEEACNQYGYPVWSYRISEFFRPNPDHNWSTRFMAVPVKSLVDTKKTIGVLRYSCSIKSKRELSELNLLYLECISQIISSLKNIKQVKILSTRNRELEKEILSFKHSGDFSSFLAFIAYSMRSNICSLYISMESNGKSILRLVDAYGISGLTGEIRSTINDYSSDDIGLTYEILQESDLDPKMYTSVVRSKNWRGRNTKLFYGKSFGELSIKDIDNILDNETKKRELLTNHPIKLLGCSLKIDEYPVGVVKVEFPKIYDDSQHYQKEDIEYFKKIASVLKDELILYQSFISGKWFKNATDKNIDEFTKLITQIFRFKLVLKKDKLNTFWANAKEYAKKHQVQIESLNKVKLKSQDKLNKPYLQMLKAISKIESRNEEWGWAKKAFITESVKQLLKHVPDALSRYNF